MQTTNIQLGSLNKMDQPFKEIMELNKKAFANFYLNPMGLTQIKKPEELMEKSMEMLVENGHETLDYLHHLFYIWEKHAFNLSDMARDKTEDLFGGAQSMTKSLMNTALQTTKKSIGVKRARPTKLASRSGSSKIGMKASPSPSKNHTSKGKKTQRSSVVHHVKH